MNIYKTRHWYIHVPVLYVYYSSSLGLECVVYIMVHLFNSEMIKASVIQHLLPHLSFSTENVSVLAEVSWVLTYLATR